MTERLKDLLSAEADGLDVPPPAAGEVLARGKGVRRRRRLAVAGAAVATVAVVGGAAFAVGGGAGEPDAATMPEQMVGPVFTVDTTVYYGDDLRTAQVDDAAVKSIFYTSAGVVVRHGDSSASDGGGPQRFSLVQADGTVHPLRLVTEGAVHASDTDEPYLVYGESNDGRLEVVVYDVLADAEAQRVVVGDTEDSWFPISLDGDTIFVENGHQGGVQVVDLASGDVTESDASTVWEAHGGYLGDYTDGGKPVVVDGRTGEVVLTGPPSGYFEISPDGRYAGLVDEEGEAGGETTEYVVYDIRTGESVTLDGYAFDFGWTPDGDVFTVEDDLVTTCDTATGRCTETAVDLPDGIGEPPTSQTCRVEEGSQDMTCNEPRGPQPPEVRLGGRAYES